MSQALHVMLVGESVEQLEAMRALFEEYGHLSSQLMVEQLTPDAISTPADLWVVEIGDESRAVEAMELLMDAVERPVVFGEGFLAGPGLDAWRRRMLEKLDELDEQGEIHWLGVPAANALGRSAHALPALKRSPAQASEPRHVWVLAASTGGPNAVKEFLDQVPAGLPVAFVYVQHINSGFEKLLVRVLGRDNSFRFGLCGELSRLEHGSVAIVPVDRQIQFGQDGRMARREQPWDGLYSPSINRVMENLAGIYGASLGVIVFTGMGDDGRAACAAVRAAGGRIWAQTAETCTIAAMPDAARSTGMVEWSATPAELAQALARACA